LRTIHSLLLLFVGCARQLRPQLLDWAARTRWTVRLLLFLAALACSAAFGSVFARLPEGGFDTICAHVLTVRGAFVAVIVLLYFIAGAGAAVLAEKARQTL
jgi:hypothetical protein